MWLGKIFIKGRGKNRLFCWKRIKRMGRKSRKQTVKWFNGGAPQFITPLNVRDMKTLGIITEIE